MVKKASKPPPFTRETFVASYNPRQSWIWPTYMIKYITQNPSTSTVYEKLTQTCKYFFIKNPILIFQVLHSDSGRKLYATYLRSVRQLIDLKNVTTKIWVTDTIENYQSDTPLNFESPNIPEFYRVDVITLSLRNEIIFNEKLLFILSKAEHINLFMPAIKNENDEIIPLEKLVEHTFKAKSIYLYDSVTFSSITSNTVRELLEIPHFFKLDKFELCHIREIFDIETFFTQAIKNNAHTKFFLQFDAISHAYRISLDEIIDEIIETEDHEYRPPLIDYYGIAKEKSHKMRLLYKK